MAQEFGRIRISELPRNCFVNDMAFHESRKVDGIVKFPSDMWGSLSNITIGFHGASLPGEVSGVELEFKSIPEIHIDLMDSNQKISIGEKCSGRWTFRLWGECNIELGNGVTSEGVDCYVNPGGSLTIGDDCLFAPIFFHVGDKHAIFDMSSGELLSCPSNPKIEIAHHVWMASGATIFADTRIGAGSIVGACSVVKGEFPDCVSITGTPGRISKRNVSWTRSFNGSEREDVAKILGGWRHHTGSRKAAASE
jgi:acetyltransferase-like isoleucine patch superfamily enzyme